LSINGDNVSLLAMVHGVAAVDIGGSVVYGAVDRNEEMGLRSDWSIGGIGCSRGYYMAGGQIFGERTTSVTSAIGLLGIFIMLFASRKSAAQKPRK
jgi:hypothetical protein